MQRMSTDIDLITACLKRHDGVEDAVVAIDDVSLDQQRSLTSYIVPDAKSAAPLRRACRLVIENALHGLSLYEPSADLIVAQKNRTETEFLYREIFVDNTYFRNGIELPDNALVIDVGGNIGMFALFVARMDPNAKIMSIEPIPELSRAIRYNGIIHNAKISAINCALGGKPGTTDFTYYPNNTVMSGRFADNQEDRETLRAYITNDENPDSDVLLDDLIADRMVQEPLRCDVMTLSQIVDQEHVEKIDLLKIDVEKAELDVLSGIDEGTWNKISQLVIEVHDINGRVACIVDMLNARGYTVQYERDQRLSKTHCFSVYAFRPENRKLSTVARKNHVRGWLSHKSLIDDLEINLKNSLPNCVVPNHFIFVDAVPKKEDGQPDFDKLKQMSGIKRPEAARNGLIPATPVECAVADLWREIFKTQAITVETNFFDLGGNSLTAVRLIARIEQMYGTGALSPDILFSSGRLRDVAAAIESARRGPIKN